MKTSDMIILMVLIGALALAITCQLTGVTNRQKTIIENQFIILKHIDSLKIKE